MKIKAADGMSKASTLNPTRQALKYLRRIKNG